MKRICIVSSTRADYGLLFGISKELSSHPQVDFRFVATGTHFQERYGYTIDEIIEDGFKPFPIEVAITGDRPRDIVRTMGDTLSKFSDYFLCNKPDLLILLGDRFEILSVAQAALIHNIPVAHIHGGEITVGAIDDSCRHALTKISALHFTSNEEHRKRVIQLGEDPARVFNFGAPGLDNILNLNFLSKSELEKKLNLKFNKKNVLVTFHPLTTSESQTIQDGNNFFNALEALGDEVSFFVTMPNADTYGSYINSLIEKFQKNIPERVFTFKSLGQLNYLSLMMLSDVVAGNSSSGIIEAPFMGKAVVNVGDRQKGRCTSGHVLHSVGEYSEILKMLENSLSNEFQNVLKKMSSVYGDGKSSRKIVSEILNQDLETLLPKKFFDL